MDDSQKRSGVRLPFSPLLMEVDRLFLGYQIEKLEIILNFNSIRKIN